MKDNNKFPAVSVEKLRWRCCPEDFPFKTTDELKLTSQIIGQERALRAIKLGLEIESMGYNIFVTGLAGTGRSTTIKSLLEEIDKTKRVPNDILYVNNFKNPDNPKVLWLPAGKGKLFQKDMEELIESLMKNIPLVLGSDTYQQKRRRIIERFRNEQKKIAAELEGKAKKEGFTLMQLQMGPYIKHDLVPLVNEKPIDFEKLKALVDENKFPKDKYDKLTKSYSQLVTELEKAIESGRELEKKLEQELTNLEKESVSPLIRQYIAEIKEKFDDEKISQYLQEVQDSIIENLNRFQVKEDKKEDKITDLFISKEAIDPFLEYRVNLVVDNSETKGSPVIIEGFPNYRNLFGTIERIVDRKGIWRTDFTKIKAGSFLQANGGYLVVDAFDALTEPGVWKNLKRTLKNQVFEFQAYDPFTLFYTSSLKPEAIDIKVKVVMIGDNYLYYLLYNYEEDFKKIFKIKADFDRVMARNSDNISLYASFIKKICQEEKLNAFDRSGVAAIVEYGVRLGRRQNKLSTEFNKIVDIIREANYWAAKDESSHVMEEHVDKALEWKFDRVNMLEDKIKELIKEGTIMINIDGAKVGELNGLSVLDLGDYSFGRPSKITAETWMGKKGVINIEREAKMSGPTYNKAVLILSGYLQGKYAHDKPLSMSTSLCFEQSYSGVEGDSASSAEVYAILSSLSSVPLRQDIAVTGSVNQKGEIQPIGGVNQKIEGFYDVCKVKGITGDQGVIIPHLNIDDLMLRKDVVKAISQGKFHVYAVKTIDEGIEILTGMKAGKRKEDGTYEDGTINYLVNKRLEEMSHKMKSFEAEEKKKNES
jgi:lon-related putative ATP-dependent protease